MTAPTLGTLTTETNSTLRPVIVDAPPVNPSPTGLFSAVSWLPFDGPPRFIADGIEIRTTNYDGLGASGVWEADWCAQPDDLTEDDLKAGFRFAGLDPFAPLVAWGYDECDLTEPSQREVRTRAAQTLRLSEQQLVERAFADRLIADADTIDSATDITGAVSQLEDEFAKVGVIGVIHASAQWAAYAAQANLLVRNGSTFRTPLGHLWVFGGGYVDGLNDTLVATAPLVGMRTETDVRETIKAVHNVFAVVAERAFVVGYEQHIGAVSIT